MGNSYEFDQVVQTKEWRINHIIELMRDLKWNSRLYPEYMKFFNVSRHVLAQEAAEASRVIRRGIDDETGGAYVLCRLENRIDACMESGDDKNLVKLLALHARLTGAEAAIRYDSVSRVEHTVKVFNPRDARKKFYEKNNRIGDMTDELNVEVVQEKALPIAVPLGNEVIIDYTAPEDDEPF
tara:strand:- start:81 stop:626 length:546 start_codon:yes stop_codon:yes gene_type:complete